MMYSELSLCHLQCFDTIS